MGKTFQEIVIHQKKMNRYTYSRLVELGHQDDKELSLDFFFICPDEEYAIQLVKFLQSETDYTVSAKEDLNGWVVVGHTRPTKISLPILDQWVEWMAAAGSDHDCEFDGWGTSV